MGEGWVRGRRVQLSVKFRKKLSILFETLYIVMSRSEREEYT